MVDGLGIVAFGRDLVSLDAILFSLLGFGLNHFKGYVNKAEEDFGAHDKDAVKEAETKVGEWLASLR
jgi:uncharacterized protein (DUF362 family)